MNWYDISLLVAGFLANVILGLLWDAFGDHYSKKIREFIAKRSQKRYSNTNIPNPAKEFRSFRIGNFEIPVMPVVGSPETPFLYDDVTVEFQPVSKDDHYPVELKAARPFLIKECEAKYKFKDLGAKDVMPRLDDVKQGPEQQGDKRGNLTIYMSLTTYGSLFTTNRSLDYSVIPKEGLISRFTTNQTIREAYCHPPYDDLGKSILANPPGVDVVVISRNLNQTPNDQIIIRQRSQSVLLYRGYYQVSATGYVALAHCDSNGIPNPFIAAISEAKQEIADGLTLSPDDFKLLGVGIKWEDLHPAFYGYIETGLSVNELLGDFKRDSYEGHLYALPFEPKSVLTHISKEKWHPASALAAIATLLTFYPRAEVELMARKLPAKKVSDFFET